MTCALAALALALSASSCDNSDSIGVPVTRPLPPFGTEPPGVTGSEPTTGGNDPLPGQGTSLEELCFAACAHLESECPGGSGADCQDWCAGVGESYPTCVAQFRAYVACITTAPIFCSGLTLEVLECDRTQSAVESCVNSSGS